MTDRCGRKSTLTPSPARDGLARTPPKRTFTPSPARPPIAVRQPAFPQVTPHNHPVPSPSRPRPAGARLTPSPVPPLRGRGQTPRPGPQPTEHNPGAHPVTVPGERTHRALGLIRDQPPRGTPPMTGRTFDFPTTLIERAVDGDSLEATVMWENPFYIGSTPMPILLRVAGVDCWDKTTPRGIAAMTRTAQLTEGRILHAVTYGPYTYGVGTRHRLGEWVGDVYVPTPDSITYGPSDTIALSTILLTERLAMPYDGKGKRPTLGLPGTWPVTP